MIMIDDREDHIN